MGTLQKISAKVRDAIRKIRGSGNTHPHVQQMTDSQLAERLVCLDEPPPTVTAPRIQPPRTITDESPDRYPFDDSPQPQPSREPAQEPAPKQPYFYPKTQDTTQRRFQP